MARDLPTNLVYARRLPLIGKMAYYFLKLLGVEFLSKFRWEKILNWSTAQLER